MMKRFLVSSSFAAFAALAFGQITGDGYYRVKNHATSRYVYLCDNTGSLDYVNMSADMGAIQLWRDGTTTNHLTNPAGVIYYRCVQTVSATEQAGDLQAQGTSVHAIIGHYVHINGNATTNRYQVFASSNGITKYLDDETTSTRKEQGVVGTDNTGTYRMWNVHPMNQTDNYLGVAPSVSANGKFYAPYYVAFPFSFYSSGMKAYYISTVDKKRALAVMKEVTGTIPASLPVIIECSSADYANNKLDLKTGSFTAPTDNKLLGVYFSNPDRAKSANAKKKYDANTMRVLGLTSEGNLGYITATNDMLNLCNGNYCLLANQSYLSVASGTPAELTIISEEEYKNKVLEIEDVDGRSAKQVDAYYTLNGQKLSEPATGINIVKYKDGTTEKRLLP